MTSTLEEAALEYAHPFPDNATLDEKLLGIKPPITHTQLLERRAFMHGAKEGARRERERILGMLRSEPAKDYWDGTIVVLDAIVLWLESELRKEDVG